MTFLDQYIVSRTKSRMRLRIPQLKSNETAVKIFDEVAGKKIKYFEALDVRVPGAGPETPEEVPEEPETEPLLGTDIEI